MTTAVPLCRHSPGGQLLGSLYAVLERACLRERHEKGGSRGKAGTRWKERQARRRVNRTRRPDSSSAWNNDSPRRCISLNRNPQNQDVFVRECGTSHLSRTRMKRKGRRRHMKRERNAERDERERNEKASERGWGRKGTRRKVPGALIVYPYWSVCLFVILSRTIDPGRSTLLVRVRVRSGGLCLRPALCGGSVACLRLSSAHFRSWDSVTRSRKKIGGERTQMSRREADNHGHVRQSENERN